MRSQDGLTPEQLPPKPGIKTGIPRPPRAPVDPGSGTGGGEQNERFKPNPPPGQGPVLEWYKGSRRRAILSGIGGVVAVAVLATLKSGVDWMSTWWMWLFALAAGPLVASSVRTESCAAGAEWFAVGKSWVRTYELTVVKLKSPTNYRVIQLEDSGGRKVRTKLMTVQENQELWDLVYNGILHSVVNNKAETNALARRAFKLPEQSDIL